jgi:hypothetical protein
MSELEKPTSTWARMRSKHALDKVALTAPVARSKGLVKVQRPHLSVPRNALHITADEKSDSSHEAFRRDALSVRAYCRLRPHR